jgi:hypothetical protein
MLAALLFEEPRSAWWMFASDLCARMSQLRPITRIISNRQHTIWFTYKQESLHPWDIGSLTSDPGADTNLRRLEQVHYQRHQKPRAGRR